MADNVSICRSEAKEPKQGEEQVVLIDVEVACAVEDLQRVISLQLPVGSSLADAVSASFILQAFPSIDLAETRFGIYGQIMPQETPLKDGDRVEVYRPLLINPMEARRLRAKRKKEASR